MRATAASLLTGAVLVSGLTGCQGDPSTSPSTSPGPTAATRAAYCDYPSKPQERAGGPLQQRSNAMEFGMTAVAAHELQDATVITLLNKDRSAVLIDRVALVPDRTADPLRLRAAFIAPPTITMTVGRTRPATAYLGPAVGYCLPPEPATVAEAPVLALRIGPDREAGTGARYYRNNSVNLHYRTSDGRRWVAVFPVQFRYPRATSG